MIWIATLCLLAIFAWLLFNGLNEMRWVEAHSHDETVAADPGILPDVSKHAAKLRADVSKLSVDDEDTPFARAVVKVREGSQKAGGWIENKAAEARASGASALAGQGGEGSEDTLVARTMARVENALGTKTMSERPPEQDKS